MENEGSKNKILEFAENHPYILLITVLILIILIVIMYLNSRGYSFGGVGKKHKKKDISDDDEIDELIESINKKQRSKE